MAVTPHAGVWIETTCSGRCGFRTLSLPTRECGLKHPVKTYIVNDTEVTPHAGVWIETAALHLLFLLRPSLPTRECGLKLLAFAFS